MSQDILTKVSDAVVDGNIERTRDLVDMAVKDGIAPLMILNDGLVKGISIVGERFATGDFFLPDLLIGSKAMDAGVKIIESLLANSNREYVGRVLMGTVEGDLHEIGKNIVNMMLSSSGFEVIDIGVNVPAETFVDKIKELKPQIVGISALLTTTVDKQKDIIDLLKETGLRDQVKVIIGGAPINQAWADQIGADGYGEDAMSALHLCQNLMKN
jgi:corrinoid protein of di/trimethylamine methyltransferase